jgi:hypothetical protein
LWEANGLRLTVAKTFETTSVTALSGAGGSLNASATACGGEAVSTVEAKLATDSTAASSTVCGSAVDALDAAALTTTDDCWSADVEIAKPARLVSALPAEFGGVLESPRAESGVVSCSATTDDNGSTEGVGSSGDAATAGSSDGSVATEEVTLGWVGVASADELVSPLDGVEGFAPPGLWTTPERAPAVEARRGEEVELFCESTELGVFSAVGPDDESAAEAEEVGSVDDGPAADSDDELGVDDESDGELGEFVSSGAANATAGVFATTTPTPSANARTPARTMWCASTGMALKL